MREGRAADGRRDAAGRELERKRPLDARRGPRLVAPGPCGCTTRRSSTSRARRDDVRYAASRSRSCPVGIYRLTLDVAHLRTCQHRRRSCARARVRGERAAASGGWRCRSTRLRSQRNWGIGDFTDLDRICAIAGDAGASLRRHQPAARLAPQRSGSRQPVRAHLAPLPQLADDRRRSRARSRRPGRADLHRARSATTSPRCARNRSSTTPASRWSRHPR